MRITLLNRASCLAIAAFASTGVVAQSNADTATSAEDPPTIIVTGQKVDQSIQQVTASVDVTTEEEILREPITDLYDIIERIPNVTAAFGEQGFAIRGIDQRGIGGNGATLTVYVDDSPLSNQTTFFGPTDSWDLGQIEVYRGPQSTNFGRNSLAGAIYLRTRDPSFDWDIKARGELGDNGVRQVALAGGGRIIDDVLAFRIAGNYRESDGFITDTFRGAPADATELKTARLKLLIQPSDNFSIITTSSYTENFAGEDGLDPTNGNPGNPVSASDVIREVGFDTEAREGTETFIQSVNATWDISSDFQLQSIFTYQDTDYLRIEDFDGTPAPIAALDRTGADEAFSEELRLKYFGEQLSGVLGFYYFTNEDGFNDSFTVPASILLPILPPTLFISRQSQTANETTNYAFFADGEFAVSESLDLLFGIRYDNEEIDNVSTAITSVPGGLPPQFGFLAPLLGTTTSSVNASYEAWLPKGGVRWNINPDTNISFVAQRAYRAGGAFISVIDGTINEFDPEYLWNYELAARTILLDGRLRWNTNVYYSDWRDQQVLEPVPGFPTFFNTVNAGESTLWGFETDFSFDAGSDVEVYGGLGYASTEFDDFPNGNFDSTQPVSEANQPNFAGNRFPNAPRWSANFGVTYSPERGLFGGIDANYQSDSFNSSENFAINQCCERVLVNARIGYAWEGLSVTAYVRNAFDEQYYSFFNAAVAGDEFARLGAPRTFAIRFDASY